MNDSSALDQRVSSALHGGFMSANRQLRFETRQGKVILQGAVASYYQKQLAQELVRRVEGVAEIENQLVVHWSDARASAGA